MNFSLYRGDLHKVPDVPRRWPLAKPSMSLQVFQKAVAKRREAVHRIQEEREHVQNHQLFGAQRDSDLGQEQPPGEAMDCSGHGAPPGKDLNASHENDRKRKREESDTLGFEAVKEEEEGILSSKERKPRISPEAVQVKAEDMDVDASDDLRFDTHEKKISGTLSDNEKKVSGTLCDSEAHTNDTSQNHKQKESEKLEAPRTPAAKDEDCVTPLERVSAVSNDCAIPCYQVSKEPPVGSKRRAELDARLKELQEKKHQLVQILKQVLIDEEESKKKAQDLEEGEFEYSQNTSTPISQGSHFPFAHPQPMGAAIVRHYNSQLSNKP